MATKTGKNKISSQAAMCRRPDPIRIEVCNPVIPALLRSLTKLLIMATS